MSAVIFFQLVNFILIGLVVMVVVIVIKNLMDIAKRTQHIEQLLEEMVHHNKNK